MIPCLCFSQEKFIKWSCCEKLSWTDFKDQAKRNVDAAAISNVNLGVDIVSKPTYFIVSVHCLFDQSKSWVIKSKMSGYLLNHEQKHFDLTEVYARKLRRYIDSLNNLKPFNFTELNELISKKYFLIKSELVSVQLEYDKSTNHCSNIEIQKVWDKKISDWLMDFDGFKQESIVIRRK
tara:strand:- start:2219 stop:2752 length:534 start_codon:yes stop_codon:yes gene_type:complete